MVFVTTDSTKASTRKIIPSENEVMTMVTFTAKHKLKIIQGIKDDGFMVSGWCKRNNIKSDLFYLVLSNQRGGGERPSPKCDHIIQSLINDGYLAAPEQQAAAA